MFPVVARIFALLSGTVLLLLGVGLLNTLLVLRGAHEGFSDGVLGLMGSSYFVGFLLGTLLGPGLIRRMGHIRAFAFFTAAVTVSVLAHLIWIDPIAWIVLRVIAGAAVVGLYIVIESWLSTHAGAALRGRVFAVYMVCNLGALAAAQQLLAIDSPAGYLLFAISAAFVCLAAMPVSATRLTPPTPADGTRMALRGCFRTAPVAVLAGVLSGLAMGAFWSLGAVWVGRLGADATVAADFMTATILGGVALQWPIGHFSDGNDRRRTLMVVALLTALAALALLVAGARYWPLMGAAFAFGGVAFSLYPIAVAHLVDHLHTDEILGGNAALLLFHGAGAAIGPMLAGAAMARFGPAALPLHFMLMTLLLSALAFWHTRRRDDVIVDAPAIFVPMVRTSPGAMDMMSAEQAAHAPTPHPHTS
ncbi:MFS transporter [Denitromonas iodatirespirans]|uniref:MFS transporter n=1 Tax=Denitromonas iodatirespirans TaxID=2795389 RepID=A0A944DC63_DENI1|nr:MFS transporter [Denitromonas iodatirespirans]MBT0960033.1 MFS transporter [Denitromonas iodatirespirans]